MHRYLKGILPNHFRADSPGDVQLHYRITDQMSSTFAESPEPHKVIHIRPRVIIMAPPPYPNNRFCYTGEEPDGRLSISCLGQAIPNDLNDQIEWSMDVIGNSSPQNDPEDLAGPSVTFQYLGLPTDNSAFGPKDIMASLPQYGAADTVEALVFYLKDSTNHPGIEANLETNWFYYWRQAACPGLGDERVVYKPGLYEVAGYKWLYYLGFDEEIWIGPKASLEMQIQPIPGIDVAWENKTGIDLAEESYTHETFHDWVWHQWAAPDGPWYILNNYHEHQVLLEPFPEDGTIPGIDSDGDMLADEWESNLTEFAGVSIQLNPLNADTYELSVWFYYPRYDEDFLIDGDQELLAMLQARFSVGDPSQDWSKGSFSRNWEE
jgi:hypothetical protein